MDITPKQIAAAEQILIDNGIDADEAKTVLQAIGFALLETDLYPPKYAATKIAWDVDADDPNAKLLPKKVIVDFDDLDLPDCATDAEVEDALSDYLSDQYGYCHNGFTFKKVIM